MPGFEYALHHGEHGVHGELIMVLFIYFILLRVLCALRGYQWKGS